jgi:hypothetical protein
VTWLPGGLSIDTATVITRAGAATKVIDAVQVTEAMTLEAWVRPADDTQFGPSRIASLSQDPYPTGGNFVLGQSADTYESRMRTSNTDQYGQPGLVSTAGTAVPGALTHIVYTRALGGAESLYQDGVLVASGTRTGSLSSWGAGYELALVNEPTVDRGWLGEIYLFAIYDRALDAGEIGGNYTAGPQAVSAPEVPAVGLAGRVGLGALLVALAFRSVSPRRRR